MHVEAKNRVQVESGHTSGRRGQVSLSRSRRWPLVASPYALRKRVCVIKVTDAVAGVRLSFNGSKNGRSLMPTFSKVNIVAITALSFLVAAPCVAFAGKGGGKSGGNSGPKESVSFNYVKTQNTYTSQKTSSKKGDGKATFHDLSITHKLDKASP